MSYFGKGIEKTQLKRDKKAELLASVRGDTASLLGMTKQEMITLLVQDIADFDAILARFRRHGGSGECENGNLES